MANTLKNLTSKIKQTSVGERVTGKINDLLHHHDTPAQSLSMHFKDTEEEALTTCNQSSKSPETPTPKTEPVQDSTDSPDSKKSSRRHSFEVIDQTTMASPEIYEQQLTQLQEQLVSVMIENGTLKTRLTEVQSQSNVSKLERDLQFEKGKNKQLVDKITRMADRKSPSRTESSSPPNTLQSTTDGQVHTDLQENTTLNDETIAPLNSSNTETERAPGWITRLADIVIYQFYVIVDDFSVTSDDFQHIELEEPLAVKTLKDNVQRFGKGLKPIFTTMDGCKLLFNWNSPLLTGSIFLLWMYSCLTGYLIPNLIFIIILRLFLNLLEEWKVIRVIQLLPKKAISDNPDSEQDVLSVSEKFNIVIQVATKVQNKLGLIADGLEKLSNLLTWKVLEHTKQIFIPLFMLLLISLYLSVDYLVMMLGLMLGLKLFIIDAIYNRFPRVKAKYDTTAKLWLQLMTNSQLEKQRLYEANNQMVLPSPTNSANRSPLHRRTASVESIEHSTISDESKEFCERFNLPYEERPVKDSAFKNGKHCVYFEKDAQFSISTALNNHCKLWLTPSFLCYEKRSYLEAIPLASITRVDKKKPISFLPGSGMALEISVTGFNKPHIFGGLIGRDDCYETLMRIGRENNLDYFKNHVENKPQIKPQMRLSEIGANELELDTIAQ